MRTILECFTAELNARAVTLSSLDTALSTLEKDYDVVVNLFGQYLQYDDNGKKHLYTPHVFFIKDGDVVYEVEGVNEQLKENYEKGFALEYE